MLVDDKENKIIEQIKKITDSSTVLNQQACYEGLKDYREYVINKILLISSSFDYFLLEEEGRLNNLFSEWCSLSEKENPPILTHIETTKDAINKIEKDNYDLIIIFNKPTDTDLKTISKKIKEKTETPIVLLHNNINSLKRILNDYDVEIDKYFTWNGDGKIILSIVRYFEDKKNLKNISKIDYKNIILIVEDSIQHYSSYLSIIYEEICNHLKEILNPNLNCEQKNLRFKRRPFVIHSDNFEKSSDIYEKYKDDIIFIISDNNLERNGEIKQFGPYIANKIYKDNKHIPLLIQSSEEIDDKKIQNKNINIISKTSPKLNLELRKFIKKNLGPNHIILEKKDKEKINIKTIDKLKNVIDDVDKNSLLICAKNNDFSGWFKAIGEIELSEKCNYAEKNITDAEEIRSHIMDIIEDYNYSINQASITSFSRKIDDPYVKITRIGDGALGGKARGLAFLAKIISKYIAEDMFPNLKITIPRSIVLSSDIFDKFMKHNDLNNLDFYHLSDERISTKFIEKDLPATILGDLRSFIRKSRKPLIVRSSGILEDSLMQPFAGIYASMVLPNESWETDIRFHEVCNAIKHVYASTYFEQARTYIKSTPKHISDEKMAVLIQELVGEKHDKFFYPTISGVAKSYNYYPQGPCKPEEGIAYLALGLGKSIVDGGASFAFCPEKPKAPLFGTPKAYMKYAQTKFYALNIRSIYKYVNYNEETSLDQLDIKTAKEHDVLEKIVSTYIPQDDSLYPGIYEGYLVVDFGPIIKYEDIPLAKAIKLLLKISEIALGFPVEIEFALNISKIENQPSELIILQIRNMVPPDQKIDVNIDLIPKEDIILDSKNILGNGIIEEIYDIIYVDQEKFDLSKSNEVVEQIQKINDMMLEKNIPYILVGPGRWGSADPWLGIPVIWSNIAGAKAIIETPYKERPIDPSQGSHFFHDMIAAKVVYIITKKMEDINWDFIKKQKIISKTDFIKHVKTKKPINIIVDGKKNRGVILKKPYKKSVEEI